MNTRRRLLESGLLAATSLWLPAAARSATCVVTPTSTPGPYFRPGAPDRTDLRLGGNGRELKLVLEGRGRDCKPLSSLVIDLWHADPNGDYDLSGFRYRTRHVVQGNTAQLDTFVPGRYPGRTSHLHITVASPGYRDLTTQLYFPDDPFNRKDFLFKPSLLLKMNTATTGSYTFYLQAVT